MQSFIFICLFEEAHINVNYSVKAERQFLKSRIFKLIYLVILHLIKLTSKKKLSFGFTGTSCSECLFLTQIPIVLNSSITCMANPV